MIINQDYTLVTQLDPGLIATDVSVKVKTPSSAVFVLVPYVDVADFVAAEGNYYNIKVPRDLLAELGTYIFLVTTPLAVNTIEKECLPYYGSTEADLCIVYGNVKDIGGNMPAYSNIAVVVYPVKLPTTNNTTFTLGHRLTVYADYKGDFTLPVLIGATVVFEIKDAGMRIHVKIPDLPTVSLVSLVPIILAGVTVT